MKNGEFNQKLSQVETDKSEIVSFWKRQVETKSEFHFTVFRFIM